MKQQKILVSKLKENKAITLIALVITIIVLLILAGVTISAISGNENTMGKAQQAKTESAYADELDSIKLAVTNAQVQGAYSLYVDVPTLREGLQGIVKGDLNTVIDADETEWQVEGNTGRIYKITNLGEVTIVKIDSMSSATLEAITVEKEDTAQIVIPLGIEAIESCSSADTSKVTVTNTGVITGVDITTTPVVVTVTGKSGESTTVNVTVIPAVSIIGQYVDYAVSYTDMYSGYGFSTTNGWRILDPGTKTTVNGVTEYTGAKIVSTGVPAKVHYHMTTNASTAASTWWGSVAQVRTLYGDTYADAGYDYNNSGYPNYFAAAGMLKNFTSIPFSNTSTPTANNGGYTSITNSAQVNGTTNTAYGSIFITNKAKTTDEAENSKETATTVHALTQEELNTAINKINGKTSGQSGYRKLTSTGSVTSYDLFYLKGLGKYNYSTSINEQPYYWLASPNASDRGCVRYVNSNGSISYNSHDMNGVRPVVSLNSNIYKDGDVWKIR